MSNRNQKFNNAWLGYDLSYNEIESIPEVLDLRQKGLRKRIRSEEHHITVGFFKEIDLDSLSKILEAIESQYETSFSQEVFDIDGIGIIKGEKGSYAFLSAKDTSNRASILKDILIKNSLTSGQSSADLHISIGGPDPFDADKKKQKDLKEVLQTQGKLVFVGNNGETYQKFEWNGELNGFQEFGAPKSLEPKTVAEKKPTLPRNISKIIMPNKPHLDPITAYYLLLRFGNEAFPGVRNASVTFWESSRNPTKEETSEWEKEGTLLLDVGEGEFDHHLTESFSSMLVAKYLGIDEKPELKSILSYLDEDDSRGLHNKFGDLAHIVKMMYKQNMDIQKIFDFVFSAMDALVYFDYESKKEFEEKSKIYRIKRGNNKVKIAVIESNNQNVSRYALQNERVAVVIQRRTSGNVMIFTNNNICRIDLRDIVGAIRKKELELAGINDYDIKSLKKEGKHPNVQNWYYHKALNAVMNGSDALQDTPPTKIPLDTIVKITLFSVSTAYPDFCDEKCQGEKCPYFEHSFYKCYAKRNGAG